jgi:hypothetical protein
MHTRVIAAGSVAAAALIAGSVSLIMATGSASAASDKPVLLGKTNTASTQTKVTNTKGPAMVFTSSKTTPPFAIGEKNKHTVKYLSADMLDGKSSGAFAAAASSTGTVINTGLAPATCPSGTKLTGGGVASVFGDPVIYSGPGFDTNGNFVANSWQGLSSGDPAGVYSLATCISLTGKPVPDAIQTNAAAGTLTKVQKNYLTDSVKVAKKAAKAAR